MENYNLNTKVTEKQLNKIVFMVDSASKYDQDIKAFWQAQAKWDWKHCDLKCDYRKAIFFETLKAIIKHRIQGSDLIDLLSAQDYKSFINKFYELRK